MASYTESVDSDSEEDSSRNLVVKLIKLEDQLGLSRWAAWSEVKVEPPDDDDDSNMMLIEEGGMEWVPVKEEPLDTGNETLTYTPEGCGEERDITTHACAAVSVAADPSLSSVVDCVDASSQEVVTIDSTTASVVVMSPQEQQQEHTEGSAPTSSSSSSSSSSHIVVADHSPPRVVSSSPSHTATSTSHSAAPTTTTTTTTTTTNVSPQVAGLGALNIQSPQVSFVTVGTKSGDMGGDDNLSGSFLPAADDDDDDDITMMDIASSQLTVVVDDQTVKGLEDVVVAAATSSPSPRKLAAAAASKRADRLAHKKGTRGRKAGTTSVKKGKEPTTARKTPTGGKKRGRPPKSASKSHVDVPDSTVTIPGTDGITDDLDDNHNAQVAPKRRKTTKKASESDDKGGIVPMQPTLSKRIQNGNGTSYNLFRLARLLPNEDGAVEFGQQYNLLPRFRFCPLCGQRLDKLYRIVRHGKRPLYRFQCNKQPCKVGRNQVPLRWGTKFVSSNLSLRKSILLDYCFIKKYDTPTARSETAMPECEESDRMVSTSTETVVDYYNHCREICAYFLMSLPQVGGLGLTVELFESFFTGSKSHNEGGSKSHKVHAFQGQYILAGICVETNDVLFAVTPDLDPGTVLPLVQRKVALGTHVRTSSCEAYARLGQYGYEHTVVRDTQLFVHNDLSFSGCCNVTQAGTMRPLAFHRRSGTFNLHLAEYLWRRRSRDAPDLFEAYLETVAAVYPITVPAAADEQEDNK